MTVVGDQLFFTAANAKNDRGLWAYNTKVTGPNQAPAGADKTLTINEDQSYPLQAADFGFSDPANNHQLLSVKIATLPAKGSLKLSGVALTAKNNTKEVTATQLASGSLVYTPAANESGAKYASFTFQVRDNGGTAGGGKDLDPTPNTLLFQVNPVNDAPAGAGKILTINEDSSHKFTLADFPFTDAEKHAFASVKISTLPAAAKGTLKLNGIALTAGKEVSAADLSKGLFTFTPAKDGNGKNFASFNFQVRDNGGTASGGIDLDPTPRTLTIHVNAVNDAPTLTTISTLTGAKRNTPFEITYALLSGAANETDPDGDPISFRIQSVSSGKLERFEGSKWVAVVAGQTLLATGQKLRWTSSTAGSALNAFTIVAWDGKLPSAPAVPVKVTVSA